MKKQQEHVIDFVFSLSLLCVFTVCGLLVVFIGVNVYKNTVENMSTAFSERTAMAYIAKQVRQNDTTDAISITEIEGEQALTITRVQSGETYCTYIYYYDGYLQELYAKDSFSPVLTAGQSLIAIDGFAVTQNEDDTLTITMVGEEGENTLILALHSS